MNNNKNNELEDHLKILFLVFGPMVMVILPLVIALGIMGVGLGFILCYPWLLMLNKRIAWTKKQLIGILQNKGAEEFSKYSSFEDVMIRWWCWDIEQFKKSGDSNGRHN